MSRPRPSKRDQFHVAIICALSLEYNAVSIVFDHFWDDEGDSYGRAPGDLNTYTTGCIGGHNVVLALLSHMGKANAASAAASLRSSYEDLKLVLLVGVCGGMPYNQFGEEVLLGDVIIGKSVTQHDFGRRYPDGFVPKDEDEDRLQKPDKLVRNLLAVFETDRGLELLENRTSNFLKEVQSKASSKRRRVNYGYPGADEDKLFESAYRHKHHLSTACICRDSHKDSDPVCTEAPTSLCFDLGCSDSHLVPRARLMELDGASSDSACRPVVHVGRIASGDTVIKSASDRDNISKKTKAIGFEMEGVGIWEEFSCIMVIKGVCDYADSHKSKLWQTYAAATAAAASKAVLKRYIQTDVPSETMKDSKLTLNSKASSLVAF
jgi:nucleoside phosphorylase